MDAVNQGGRLMKWAYFVRRLTTTQMTDLPQEGVSG